jgi:5-oxoprolinase (ATP-hydrolysing)
MLMATSAAGWKFWIDRGGTFTDVVALEPNGTLQTAKLLSDDPGHYEDAAVEGIRQIFGLSRHDSLPVERISVVKMGTTVGTNALLERKGERMALVTNRGFQDVLRIGTQQRPKLFDLDIKLPDPLYERVIECAGRMSSEGDEIERLDLAAARNAFEELLAAGIYCIAIVLMHGYRYPRHEQILAQLARDLGFMHVYPSHETSQLVKFVDRGHTTVVDAYLSPLLRKYVERLHSALPGVRLLFMQSNGGLVDASHFRGKDSILSGPAAGVVGAAKAAAQAGFERIIAFDMGGTSTDVTHYAGEFERRFETEIAGIRMCSPMIHIHTVAAGGGSICRFDGTRLRVGPESAGAYPGPACYRRGGPLTVTDCNVALGRLPPQFFPSIFGPERDLPLDPEIVRNRLSELAGGIEDLSAENLASGFLQIAVENMANAIKKISVAQGYDVSQYTLVTFGGAGGQHACAVADALGMDRVLIHPFAGVLSAFGMGLAEVRVLRERSIEKPFDKTGLEDAGKTLNELASLAENQLLAQEHAPGRTVRKLHIRYKNTNTPLPVDFGTVDEMKKAFLKAHRSRFGFDSDVRPMVIDSVSAEAIGENLEQPDQPREHRASAQPESLARLDVFFKNQWMATPIFDRASIPPCFRIRGPAIIVESTTTTVVEPEWIAEITSKFDLLLSRFTPRASTASVETKANPILLEVFGNLFISIAEQMGAVLQNCAYSVNIKERLDFSCALFDAEGQLVANAPHVPVHLGSMGTAVRAIIERRGRDVQPGDTYALNDPFAGGTHLPDITVVTPLFADSSIPQFWVASRGHHADVGGITPGSMPPDSKVIEEEGVLITDFLLVRQGEFREAAFLGQLSGGNHPARNLEQNLGDIRAQIAANEKGIQELKRIVDQFGLEVVQAHMHHVRQNAATEVQSVISRLHAGRFIQEMDSGARISVRVEPEPGRVRIDFSGTSAQRPDNFNAPSSIVRAVILYVLRTLVNADIPLNDGCLEAVDLVIPRASMLAPLPPSAVAAGNVETSQALANALYGALGCLAGSQGTMNNLTFGNEKYQYYETICGGAGAGRGFNGAAAVHTHMTNSRLTDPEILELRYPVFVESFAIRRGSGGHGRWRGGDGVVRKIRFREPMTVAILANSRRIAPFGMDGGHPGKVGRTTIARADQRFESFGSCAKMEVQCGDVIIVETPGGGGFGRRKFDFNV